MANRTGLAKDKRRNAGRGAGGGGGGAGCLEEELVSSILLEDGDAAGVDRAGDMSDIGLRQPAHYPYGGAEASPFFGGAGASMGGGLEAYDSSILGGSAGDAFGSTSSPISTRGYGRSTPSPVSTRGLDYGRRANGEAPNRTPTRTPSPVYQWNHPKKVNISDDSAASAGSSGVIGQGCGAFQGLEQTDRSSSSTSKGSDPQVIGAGGMPFAPFFNPYWPGALNPAQAQAYYGLMMSGAGNPLMATQQAAAAMAASMQAVTGGATAPGSGGAGGAVAVPGASGPSGGADSKAGAMAAAVAGIDPGLLQAMMAVQQAQGMAGFQAMAAAQVSQSSGSSAPVPGADGSGAGQDLVPVEAPKDAAATVASSLAAPRGSGGPAQEPGRRKGGRNKAEKTHLEAAGGAAGLPAPPGAIAGSGGRATGAAGAGAGAVAAVPGPVGVGAVPQTQAAAGTKDRGGGSGGGAGGAKAERRRRGGGGGGGATAPAEDGAAGGGASGGKSRSSELRGPPSQNPLIEQLKARDRHVELSDLAWNISEIAQDQYGSRLIQQKLEVANDEEKQIAFKSVLQKMSQLTTDVFGNYVIQKFFEFGNPEQRRILAEQLVGQVLRLSLQMYGCRVVQKALDSVPIEQQVLLVGELKGHVIKCIEDQHGNHVIQKCIERLPTDRINFVVESFEGQTCRMAKHCYGCRVIQRLIEYCSSQQISNLLEEVLRNSMDLSTDQYGNYVVQHVMEHSSRPGDRFAVLDYVKKNVLSLSCHKYASNVVEKALSCSTIEERAVIIQAIVGEHGDPHPPLLTMMRDRFGNYIVQRTIALAHEPQRTQLIWKLHEQMPALKKSNTYGKHIISALERAQAQGPPQS